jgi:hypothetical protein
MHAPAIQTGSFQPRLSWPVATFGVVLALFLAAGIVPLVWTGLPLLQTLACIVVLLGMALYVVDAVFFTRYLLTEKSLVITGQLRQMEIPYSQIRKVRHGSVRSLVTIACHKRHALSPACIVLDLEGLAYRSVSLNPSKDRLFLNALMHNLESTAAHAA